MKKSVLVGVSGGIDSAMTVRLLQQRGFEVSAVHFNFYNDDISSASQQVDFLAYQLNIPVQYYDARILFRDEVIEYFTRFYLEGRTPSPCAHCNMEVKLKLLLQLAGKHHIDYIATGHYVNVVVENGIFRIIRGVDPKKDQSYYLWSVPQSILKRLITPLGQMRKEEVKTLALEQGFETLAIKKESAGLCFAKGRSTEEMLRDYIPNLDRKIGEGIVLDRNNRAVGSHKGYVYYTIGQKNNFELDCQDKLSITRIDSKTNSLFVDHWNTLYTKEFKISDVKFYIEEEVLTLKNITTRIRGFGLNPEGFTQVQKEEGDVYSVQLESPAWATAPGQPAVFYQGNRLLGGGIIV